MQGPNTLLSIVTIPPGAGPGLSQVQRIVIDGTRGAIFEYDASNNLVSSWAAKAGTDSFGNAYPEGLQVQGSLIVTGSNGLFIYNGTPALGNPPVIWMVPPGVTTDPYGNTLTGIVGFGNPTGSQFEFTSAGVEYLRNSTHNRVIAFDPVREAIFLYAPSIGAGNLVCSISNNSGTDTQGNAYVAANSGGFTTYSIIGGVAVAVSYGAGGIGVYTAATEAGPYTLVNGAPFLGYNAALGKLLVEQAMTATAGSITNPTLITTDSWNAVTFQNSWANSGSGPTCKYRLTTDNEVEVIGDLTVPVAAPNTVIFTLPAAYRPLNTQQLEVLLVNPNPNTAASQPPASYRAFCGTNGSVTANSLPTGLTSARIYLRGKLSLDA